jgi:hypothetical protein
VQVLEEGAPKLRARLTDELPAIHLGAPQLDRRFPPSWSVEIPPHHREGQRGLEQRNMVREPILTTVAISDLRPTQILVTFCKIP